MKLLILSDGFPPNHAGGAEVIAFDLAKSLQKIGNHVYVITTVWEKSEAGQFNYRGLKIFRILKKRWYLYFNRAFSSTLSR